MSPGRRVSPDRGPRTVTLLTDFGTVDGYAAAMVGVITADAPLARIDHASHDIPPGDLFTAALTLDRYAFFYPEQTVHLIVVDPGVGTDRRAIACRVDGRFFVAPDNGVLTRILQRGGEWSIIELEAAAVAPGRPLSSTFHGRDLFAPAAARLARGEPLESLGAPVADPVVLSLPRPERTPSGIVGEVIQVDRYGNLITNVPGSWVDAGESRVMVEDRSAGPLHPTYGGVEPGALLTVVGSLGLLEVSVRDGSAADRLGAGRGARVRITGNAAGDR